MQSPETSLLWQLLQNMDSVQAHANQPLTEASQQRTPFDMLIKLRPMLSTREQKFIDLMIKLQEVMVLMDEISSAD